MSNDALPDNQGKRHQSVIPVLLLFSCVGSCLLAAPMAMAQVTPDGSLSTTVNTNGNNFTIENGNRVGNNLFHSFQEFSVPTNGLAFFNNAPDVQNIFSRVTGGKISQIDGLIRANGGANLFLLNPAGIVFGLNARLNIGGSFFGTTADSILFADGVKFNTTNLSAPPLLTVNVPIGLQFGQTPGEIRVQGSGHRLNGSPVRPTQLTPSQTELRVSPGNTLALVGGNLTIAGGTLTAPEGHLALGSVQGSGLVGLTPIAQGFSLDYTGVPQLGDIRLTDRALGNVSGSPAGSIRVQGRQVSMSGASLLLGQSSGEGAGGVLQVRASERLAIDEVTPDPSIASGVVSESQNAATGGRIEIETPQLLLGGASQIVSRSVDRSIGGSIDIRASESAQIYGVLERRTSTGTTTVVRNSFLGTTTSDNAIAGNVNFSTPFLSVFERGILSTNVAGTTPAGDMTINADRIELTGGGIIASTSYSSGAVGRITVNTGVLTLQTGGNLRTDTFGSGEAGTTIVRASDRIEISGVALSGPSTGRPSQISSSASNANPSIQRLFGASGSVTGDSGQVTIETPRLLVTDGAQVAASNQGPGQAGSLAIAANSIELNNGGKITASTASGEGGNITINTINLQLRNSSQIAAEAGGTGNGGNIALDSKTIALLENSRINANAFQGTGGNIQISTQGLFSSPNSAITASSQFGLSGTVAITNPQVETHALLVELPQNLVDPSQQITSGCDPTQGNTFTVAGRGGLPEDPTSGLLGRAIWFDDRDLSADGNTAALPERKLAQSQPTQTIQEATGWVINAQGQVELVANSPRRTSSWELPASCQTLR